MGVNLKFLVVLLCLPVSSFAASNIPSYEGELQTQIEFRQDVSNHDSIPFDNYIQLDVKDLKGSSLYMYGKLWKDLGYGGDWKADLYQLYADVPIKSLNSNLYIGRQFLSEGFETYVADAVKYEADTSNGINYVFYLGKPRDFEPGDTSAGDFLYGFKLNYKGLFFGFENLRDDFDTKKSSFVVGNYNNLNDKLSYYSRFEFDAAHGRFIEANAGINLKPTRKLRFNLDADYYNPSYTFDGKDEDPIFSLFSTGRELSLTESAYYDLNDNWQAFESYSHTNLRGSGKDIGHIAKVGFVRDTWFENGLRLYGDLKYVNSWIGILRGADFGFSKWLNDKISLNGGANIGRFSKITYGKQWANAYYLNAKYSLTDFSNLEIGIDDRKDEDFDRDTRVMMRFNYYFFSRNRQKEVKR